MRPNLCVHVLYTAHKLRMDIFLYPDRPLKIAVASQLWASPKVMWPALGELAVYSSSCHHLVTIWLEETWLLKPQDSPPPLPPTHSSSELHPPACEPDHLNTKQRNKDILKIEMLWLSKKHAAETQRGNGERQKRGRNKRQGKTRRRAGLWQESETLYWCRIGGWIHWFPVGSCPVTYGWFVIQYRFKHCLWTCSKPGSSSFSVRIYTHWIIMLPQRKFPHWECLL